MIIKILGILDIFIAIIFWTFGVFRLEFLSAMIFVLGIILLIKGLVFITGLSFASAFDMISALVIIFSASIVMPRIVVIIVSLFLLQKGVISLIS
jgi:hypothetical protein